MRANLSGDENNSQKIHKKKKVGSTRKRKASNGQLSGGELRNRINEMRKEHMEGAKERMKRKDAVRRCRQEIQYSTCRLVDSGIVSGFGRITLGTELEIYILPKCTQVLVCVLLIERRT